MGNAMEYLAGLLLDNASRVLPFYYYWFYDLITYLTKCSLVGQLWWQKSASTGGFEYNRSLCIQVNTVFVSLFCCYLNISDTRYKHLGIIFNKDGWLPLLEYLILRRNDFPWCSLLCGSVTLDSGFPCAGYSKRCIYTSRNSSYS